jgi:hypothetical protein
MTSPKPTDRTVAQGRALMQAIEAFRALEPSHPFERELTELFQAACRRRLMDIIEGAPPWVADEILSASEQGTDQRARP